MAKIGKKLIYPFNRLYFDVNVKIQVEGDEVVYDVRVGPGVYRFKNDEQMSKECDCGVKSLRNDGYVYDMSKKGVGRAFATDMYGNEFIHVSNGKEGKRTFSAQEMKNKPGGELYKSFDFFSGKDKEITTGYQVAAYTADAFAELLTSMASENKENAKVPSALKNKENMTSEEATEVADEAVKIIGECVQSRYESNYKNSDFKTNVALDFSKDK